MMHLIHKQDTDSPHGELWEKAASYDSDRILDPSQSRHQRAIKLDDLVCLYLPCCMLITQVAKHEHGSNEA